MQDVFAKALGHWHEFRDESSPLTWLVRIATHHCLNVLRAERAPWHQRFERETRARGEGHGGPQLFEDREAVQKLLAKLDLETQQAAIHYFVDEMTLDEVAAAIGRSVPTVRKRLASVAGAARAQIEQLKVTHESGAAEDEHIGELALRRRRAGEALGAGRPGDRGARDGVRRLPGAHPRARRRAAPVRAGDLVRSLRGRRRAGGAQREQAQAAARRSAERLGGADAGDGGVRGRDGHVRPAPGRARRPATRIEGRRRHHRARRRRRRPAQRARRRRPSRSRAASGCASATSRATPLPDRRCRSTSTAW